jgi:Holliday junction resolvasome RuvABC DNA-binding subunit
MEPRTLVLAADVLEVVRPEQKEPEIVHVENAKAKASETAEMRADATLALTGLRFTKREAMRAVSEALAEDEPHDLEALIRSALRRCTPL